MASLKTLKKNLTAINDGEWVSVTLDSGDTIKVKSRGFTDAYRNAQTRRHEKAKKSHPNGSLPVELRRAINCDLLAQHVFLDIEGLDDDGRPVTAEEVKAILRDPQLVREFEPLVDGLFAAQTMVDEGLSKDCADAVGNSLPPSATI